MKPIYSYINPYLDRKLIYKDLKNKSGIYLWTNMASSKKYVGSSVNLSRRLKDYFNRYYLESEVKKNNSLIYKALLKYNYTNFKLDIIELCDPKFLIDREQFYLNTLDLKYNILKTAGSLLGFKHSCDSKEKMRIAKTGLPFLGNKQDAFSNCKSLPVLVKDINTGQITHFPSIRRAALFVNVHYSYLSECLSKKGFYKNNNYYITKNLDI